MDSAVLLLSAIVFLPALGAVVLLLPGLFPKEKPDGIRFWTLAVTAVVFVLTVVAAWPTNFATVGPAAARMQSTFNFPWIPSFGIHYAMGLDGISLPLVVLTSFISLLAMGASWNITRQVKAYCVLFLLLETGMLGVFMALDFFLFYVFWEVMLLPMYFLIGVWGGPRREYAAIKFFLYTLVGSVLMLIALLILYFNSDLRELAKVSDLNGPSAQAAVHWADLHIHPDVERQVHQADQPVHTFNLLALAAMAQHTSCFSRSLQWWCFLLLLIGFIIKVPSVPVHTWLPDAHVEAPTPISMILAGILLKMGGYGIIRICYPICPWGGWDLRYVVCAIGLVSMVYGAFAAMAQKDFKRLVAYSSVSHMGYVVLGFGVWSVGAGTLYNPDYWDMGIKGAMFQMIAHGISSAGMFFMVGVVYDRVHHRNLDQFGGLFGKMPVYTALSIGIFFAALGLPGLCGFIGEVLVVLSVWKFLPWMAVIAASVVIITAGYILWTVQRVYLGAQYDGPHEEALTPITPREFCVALPLFIFAIVLGVFPHHVPVLGTPSVLQYMDSTVDHQVRQLADWTRREPEGIATAGVVPQEDAADPAPRISMRPEAEAAPAVPAQPQVALPAPPVLKGGQWQAMAASP